MKNGMVDLNNHLFEMLERLNDDELTGKDLDQECRRAKAMASIGAVICKNAANAIAAQRLKDEQDKLPEFIDPEKERRLIG